MKFGTVKYHGHISFTWIILAGEAFKYGVKFWCYVGTNAELLCVEISAMSYLHKLFNFSLNGVRQVSRLPSSLQNLLLSMFCHNLNVDAWRNSIPMANSFDFKKKNQHSCKLLTHSCFLSLEHLNFVYESYWKTPILITSPFFPTVLSTILLGLSRFINFFGKQTKHGAN
jgi:hypothetical protein